MPLLRNGPKRSFSTLIRKRVSRDVTSRAVFDFMSALDCPRSLTIWLLFREEEHQQLADLDININSYISREDACAAYLATCYLSKYGDFSLDVDKRQAALKKFDAFELQCKATNRYFRANRAQSWKNSELAPLLSAMAFKIDSILGDLDVHEIFDSCDWGPGASTRISSRSANHPHKFQYEIGITRGLYDLLCPGGSLSILRGYSPRWANRLIEEGFPLFEPGNKVVTVPKSSKIDRVIAIEPGLNLWFQKGVGAVMKRRLRKWGIDLTDQRVNQEFARISSSRGHLATVDFSSASDSIATEVVKEVFPPQWLELLRRLRCERGYVVDGESYTWEKFSSMGNGFTFEVETLIFFALAKAVADQEGVSSKDVSIYGDDVIIPVSIYDAFRRAAELCGFTLNSSKSYASGPFRESCGAHWYDGFDFKPVYLKGKLNTVQSVYRHANAIRRLAHRQLNYSACDARFRKAFYHLVYSVSGALRLWIPETLGDGGFIGNFDEASPKRAKFQIEGFDVRHVVDLSVDAEVDYDGLFLSRLKALPGSGTLQSSNDLVECVFSRAKALERIRNLSKRSSRNSVTTRDRTRPVLMTSLAPSWYNLGPWV